MGGPRHSGRVGGLCAALVGGDGDRLRATDGWIGFLFAQVPGLALSGDGKANEHNHLVPRDHWLEKWERDAIVSFFHKYPLEGYRRLCFMMLDRDIVAVSPASVYRVLMRQRDHSLRHL